MLSKNKIKYIRSLEHKKYRKQENAFIAEGPKVVCDLADTFGCKILAATPRWLAANPQVQAAETIEVKPEELAQASFLKTPQEVLAVFELPETRIDRKVLKSRLCLGLDDIQDPGNLGTIVRLADWFGIEYIFCSPHTADIYNPKAIQATMGAIARVKVHYGELEQLLADENEVYVYGTFLDGENIYSQSLSKNGLIIMGNEGNGISPGIEKLINRRLFIPSYPQDRQTSESLNVAIATAIVCSEFRRQHAI